MRWPFPVLVLALLAACGSSASSVDAGAPRLAVTEWAIPRADSFPHDPAVDSRGVAWWADQNNSVIGRWDPATGATQDWPTPTPACGPHGITPDEHDALWYTGSGCGLIGRLDPATGVITEYGAMGSPHTAAFQNGALWFTINDTSRYGRLSPTDGSVETWPTPIPDAGPYGLWPAPDGTVWVALFGTNALGQIDPARPAAMRVVTLPHADARPRRVAVDTGGAVYYTDYPRGRLGRLVPATGELREWASPGGDGSAPYGITVGPDRRIYYAESASDTIVAFDPATEAMETIPIPTKGSIVRNMTTDFTRRRVWMALSGVGRMAYITVP